MERTKYIPSIISLSGGLLACIITMINPYETYEMFLIILAALIVFYIVGSIARMIINKILFITKVEEDDETTEEDGEATENTEDGEAVEGEASEGE